MSKCYWGLSLDQTTSARGKIRSPGRPRDARKEEIILRETLAVLSEKGFSGLTVDAVVARAKISKATIYRRWATKEELAIAALNLLPPIESPNKGSLEDDVQAYVEQYTHYLKTTSLRTVLPALVSEAMHNADLASKLRQLVVVRRASGIEMIERAIERGELPPQTNAELAQELLIAPMVRRSFFEPDSYSIEDFRIISRIIIAGLQTFQSGKSQKPVSKAPVRTKRQRAV